MVILLCEQILNLVDFCYLPILQLVYRRRSDNVSPRAVAVG